MSSCLPSAHLHLSCTEIVASNLFGTRDGFHGRQLFPQVVFVCVCGGGDGSFQDDSRALHLLFTLFLLLLH